MRGCEGASQQLGTETDNYWKKLPRAGFVPFQGFVSGNFRDTGACQIMVKQIHSCQTQVMFDEDA